MEKLYTVQEIAARVNVTPATVRRWISRGALVAVRRGGRLLIPEAAARSLEHLEVRPHV